MTIDQLKKSAVWERNKHLFDKKPGKKDKPTESKIGGKIVSKVYPQASIEKMSIEANLFEFSQKNVTTLYSEYRFCEERRFRFDWALPDIMLAVEYEGIFSEKSGHTTVTGYVKDSEKYNLAAQYGWTVIRYTAVNYQGLPEYLKNSYINNKDEVN